MPSKDGTGPMGQGSRTGRGMGNCNTSPKKPKSDQDFGVPAPLGSGRGLFGNTFRRLFRIRRGNRLNRR